ncbi:pyridoxal phosphate-dependent aminotransferase [Solirubrobacter sp. CPCC 204708]|uniref:Aminotransferase n=1 Tax=Solirubrobacter deserti TaxID=2282478 RepID=A0ABT4RG53_9ACTN|nr:pyridoxal phosphate-dependent aminotransferase [Solirubrobacter deserti]MBE2318228.1 pyridoxal phosphate-dependent aminotransferase [Solirubrobacter deserti]MDA0137509.1 pyridoxal phosphate-dependent aminotransferase [Solirubrobacter deserti]
MRRLLRYYRQFDELSPEEVSAELRARRDAERALVAEPPLDLSGSAWHGPPHPELVNAATFALRRAVNDYADVAPLRDAIARLHDIDPGRVVVGHGAGELLRAALRNTTGKEVAVVWPGWQRLPALVEAAGATPVPVAGIAPERTTVLTTPADPSGAVTSFAGGDDWLIVDEALADFAEDAPIVDHPRVIQVRSFSKGHAMAGFRVGYAVLGTGVELPLAPAGGVGAAAVAGALWAVEHGAASVARRREQVARERARLAAALGDRVTPGVGPYVWLRADAAQLAAAGVYVAPGSAWGSSEHVRVTLRDAAATDRLLAALE